jgi:DNA-binding response OmpR family regulator
VDDEPALLRVFARQLADLGHTVFAASGVEAALSLARRHTPDVVVTDVDLAGESGFDLLRGLRAAGIACGCIAMTGRLTVELPCDLAHVPILYKPFDSSQLAELVTFASLRMSG